MIFSRRYPQRINALAVLVLAITSGCSDGKPPIDTSHNEATVTGVVTVKGTPATGGKINFNPSNSGRIVGTNSGDIRPDGTYTVKTLTGGNLVTFSGEVALKNKGIGLLREYADIKTGENKIDYDLLGAGAKIGTFDVSQKPKGNRAN
jgi:hypothetical protein